jgi:hypothetical protein
MAVVKMTNAHEELLVLCAFICVLMAGICVWYCNKIERITDDALTELKKLSSEQRKEEKGEESWD